jgi:hypothetical protein
MFWGMRAKLMDCLLVLIAIVLTYLAAEAAFSLVGLRYVPLRLHADLPWYVRVFAQSSKAGVVPRDPVLLLGDSYAQGLGDWLLAADPDRNGSFSSAHVINKLSGRDVINLGVSGAGSAEGMAAFPAFVYAEARRAWYLRLPLPEVAVVYFYEGNDFNDNLGFLGRRLAGGRQIENLDAAGLSERIDRAIEIYPPVLRAPSSWSRHFPFFLFLKHIVERISRQQTSTENDPGPRGDARPPNIVNVGGHAAELPANLQSPAMELTGLELERAALVFERSLAFLRKLLTDRPVLVAYLPSPLSSYQLVSPEVSVQRYLSGRAVRYPSERVAKASDEACHLIRAVSIANGAGLLDLRPAIRAASIHEILHGPRDFKHFNRRGMEVLGQAINERVNSPLTQGRC